MNALVFNYADNTYKISTVGRLAVFSLYRILRYVIIERAERQAKPI